MGKKSTLLEIQRAQIVTLRGEGYTERDTAAKLRSSKTAVHNAIVKFNADGTFQDRTMSTNDYAEGRPLSETDSNTLNKELLNENPYYFTLKGYSNTFQHWFETIYQRI